MTTVGTPNLTWEVATKWDLGIDWDLFHGLFTGTIDYFHDKRTDIFMKRNNMPLWAPWSRMVLTETLLSTNALAR